MVADDDAHTLAFLLAFAGRIHHLERGYWLKFEIKRVPSTPERPHGLDYSLTLHDPTGRRLIGFDNAHAVPVQGARFKPRSIAVDHWHRTERDSGKPYTFMDAATLIDDFFDEVERVLVERGISSVVVRAEDKRGTE